MAAAFVAGDAVHTQGNRYLFFDIHSDRLRIAAASILNTFAGNFARKFYHKRESCKLLKLIHFRFYSGKLSDSCGVVCNNPLFQRKICFDDSLVEHTGTSITDEMS